VIQKEYSTRLFFCYLHHLAARRKRGKNMTNKEISGIIMERGVSAIMRDGTALEADIYRPAKEGKYPVLLQRLPYNKKLLTITALVLDPITAAHAGYVVINQDVRGCFESEGHFDPYRDEFNDGYDSVEWAASLPYSDGNVGMYGVSYLGGTQFFAAVMQPPHLKAIFPIEWGMDMFYNRGGAFQLGFSAYWALQHSGPNTVMRSKAEGAEKLQNFLKLIYAADHIEEAAYFQLPLKDMPWLKIGDGIAPFFEDWLEHDTFDEFYQKTSVRPLTNQLEVPAFCMCGWYDAIIGPNLEYYQSIKAQGGSEVARNKTKLMIGPWSHGSFLNTVGELNFGLSTVLLELKRDLTTLHLQWFDFWLKNAENGIEDEAPVKIFVMGENKWRDEQEWPLARAEYTPFYFHSDGHANTRHGDGSLSTMPPTNKTSDQFIYDPQKPVPTTGGNLIMPLNYIKGPMNQAAIEDRDDVLVYTTEPLKNDTEITGPVNLKLFAVSSAPDTDFTAKLVDVYPDGKAYNVADGIIRARYRNADEAPTLIIAGEVYEYEIDLWATSNVFKVGHRIRVDISSSDFPRYDRNTNTGILGSDSSELVVAKQTVLHSDRYPSHIILPIIPR